jgi:steroid delta-isomerase-like uncharacterized protein
MTTATKTPVEVAQAAFEAVRDHDLDRLVSLAAPDCVDDFVAVGEFHGPQAIRAFFAEMLAAFPDFAMVPDSVIAEEAMVVTQWHATGTFTGSPFQGIAATGRSVLLRGIDVMEVRDGFLRRNTVYYDALSLARQIGLLPAQHSTGDRMLTKVFNAKTKLMRR